MDYKFSIRTAFVIVFASILSAFLSGGLVLGLGLYFPETTQKNLTFISFIVGQCFMLIPLVFFLILKKEPIYKRLRINLVSYNTLSQTIIFSIGLIILCDEFDRLI